MHDLIWDKGTPLNKATDVPAFYMHLNSSVEGSVTLPRPWGQRLPASRVSLLLGYSLILYTLTRKTRDFTRETQQRMAFFEIPSSEEGIPTPPCKPS